MLSAKDNELLTRVGPGTECGDMLRRYWWPVQFAENITNKPVKVRLLGEDFVVYRGENGKLALLDLLCTHRLTSLEYGRVEGNAIRCPYHAWLFDADGKCLAQPAERPTSTYKDKVRQGAYEVDEIGGLVFAYIGPKPAPAKPNYDILYRADGLRTVGCDEDFCNWLQKAENGADLPHLPFLHADVFPDMAFKTPEGYEYEQRDYGFKGVLLIEGLRPRVVHYVMPSHSRFSTTPPKGMPPTHDMRFRVPVDDTLTHSYWVRLQPREDGEFKMVTQGYANKQIGVYPKREDGYWNIPFSDQDRMAQETQGFIADRTKEHLAESDRGIIMLRGMFKDAIKEVAEGRDPKGVIRGPQPEPIEFEATMSEKEYIDPASIAAE